MQPINPEKADLLTQILTELIGSTGAALFVAALFWALFGALFSVVYDLAKRDPTSERTPVKLSAAFWFRDNWPRLAVSLMTIILGIRFYPDLFDRPLGTFGALIVGVTHDRLASQLRRLKKQEPEKANT